MAKSKTKFAKGEGEKKSTNPNNTLDKNPSNNSNNSNFRLQRKRGPQPRPKPAFVQCDHCGEKFTRKIHIHAHMDKHRSDVSCRVCHAHFSRRNTLRMHLRTHFESFVCELCGFTTTSKSVFESHKRLHTQTQQRQVKKPPVRGEFPCSQCGLILATKPALACHVQRHEIHSFACKHCEFTVSTQKELREHVLTHSKRPLLFCEYANCDFYHDTVKRLNMHRRDVHESREDAFACVTCGRRFKLRQSLMRHLKNKRCVPLRVRKLNEGRVHATKCAKQRENKTTEELEEEAREARLQFIELGGVSVKFTEVKEEITDTQVTMVAIKSEPVECEVILSPEPHVKVKEEENFFPEFHVKVEENTESVFFTCDQCGKQFTNLKRLSSHMKNVHTKSTVACPHCTRKFKQKSLLTRHIEEAHERARKFSCQFCGKAFKRKEHLEDHETRHAGSVACHVCGKLVTSLEAHVKNVHGAKKERELFPCTICGKRFNKYALKSHVNSVHRKLHSQQTTERVCNECGETFARVDDLKKHELLTHFVGMIKHCHFGGCGKMFKSTKLLNMHMREVHERTEAITCGDCGKSFCSTTGLRKHAKKKHGGGF